MSKIIVESILIQEDAFKQQESSHGKKVSRVQEYSKVQLI